MATKISFPKLLLKVLLVLSLSIFPLVELSFADHIESDLTTELLRTAGFYNRSPAAEKSRALAALLGVAARREAFSSEPWP